MSTAEPQPVALAAPPEAAPPKAGALSAATQSAIEALAHRYANKRAACVEALKLVQRERRWVDDRGLDEVARLLDMSPSELDAVATYYNLIYRRPVGRHVILLCDSVSCWLMGHDRLRAGLERRLGIGLGQTSADERFTLLPIVCLGHCDHAPALMIDEQLYGDVDPDSLDPLLERYP